MAYILREYRCTWCGHRWEALTRPTFCPQFSGHVLPEQGIYLYDVEAVIGKPASYKHSSWESWRK